MDPRQTLRDLLAELALSRRNLNNVQIKERREVIIELLRALTGWAVRGGDLPAVEEVASPDGRGRKTFKV